MHCVVYQQLSMLNSMWVHYVANTMQWMIKSTDQMHERGIIKHRCKTLETTSNQTGGKPNTQGQEVEGLKCEDAHKYKVKHNEIERKPTSNKWFKWSLEAAVKSWFYMILSRPNELWICQPALHILSAPSLFSFLFTPHTTCILNNYAARKAQQ